MSWRWERRERRRKAELDRIPQVGRSVFEIERLIEERDAKLRRKHLREQRRRKEQDEKGRRPPMTGQAPHYVKKGPR